MAIKAIFTRKYAVISAVVFYMSAFVASANALDVKYYCYKKVENAWDDFYDDLAENRYCEILNQNHTVLLPGENVNLVLADNSEYTLPENYNGDHLWYGYTRYYYKRSIPVLNAAAASPSWLLAMGDTNNFTVPASGAIGSSILFYPQGEEGTGYSIHNDNGGNYDDWDTLNIHPMIINIVDPNGDEDGDGVINSLDELRMDGNCSEAWRDVDSDGVCDDYEDTLDADGDGEVNYFDVDDDNDGVADYLDELPLDSSGDQDFDNDGYGPEFDIDEDADGIVDAYDSNPTGSCTFAAQDPDAERFIPLIHETYEWCGSSYGCDYFYDLYDDASQRVLVQGKNHRWGIVADYYYDDYNGSDAQSFSDPQTATVQASVFNVDSSNPQWVFDNTSGSLSLYVPETATGIVKFRIYSSQFVNYQIVT
ncbi:MAG: hypothetical protein KDI30_09795, partial [Pseudomonadales bacterium]|nr:hypothetical protein [Pseudomonadales bacterium]